MTRRLTLAALCTITAVSLSAQAPSPGDWPQWRGPNRDGVSSETGLAQEWPAKGPPVVWKITGIGAGYGTVAVSGARTPVGRAHCRSTWLSASFNAPSNSRCQSRFSISAVGIGSTR